MQDFYAVAMEKLGAVLTAQIGSALIVDRVRALVLDEEFYTAEHCKRYHEQLARLGTTSMEAAGWQQAT